MESARQRRISLPLCTPIAHCSVSFITDLRDLSLADARQLSLRRRSVDLAVLCQESVDAMRCDDERKVSTSVRVRGRRPPPWIPIGCAKLCRTCCTMPSGSHPPVGR